MNMLNKSNKSWTMSFCAAALVSSLVMAPPAFAKKSAHDGYTGAQQNIGGYAGPGPQVITVKEALSCGDDAWVALRGNIIQSIGPEDYLFQDATGTIHVEIDHKYWRGQTVGLNDVVEIQGEIDKDFTEHKVDVKRIVKK